MKRLEEYARFVSRGPSSSLSNEPGFYVTEVWQLHGNHHVVKLSRSRGIFGEGWVSEIEPPLNPGYERYEPLGAWATYGGCKRGTARKLSGKFDRYRDPALAPALYEAPTPEWPPDDARVDRGGSFFETRYEQEERQQREAERAEHTRLERGYEDDESW